MDPAGPGDEFLNTSFVAHEPEPVRLDPLQGDVERLYAEKVAGSMTADIVQGTADALAELGWRRARRLRRPAARAARAGDTAGLRIVDALDAWLDVRKVKTPQEIEFLRRGATINEDGLREIMPDIKPGAVWRDVATQFRNYVQGRGANLLSAQKALQFGAEYGGEYFPDLMFADNDWKVHEGQVIIFESWGTYSNYAFDVSRTVHVGEPTAEYRDLCETSRPRSRNPCGTCGPA